MPPICSPRRAASGRSAPRSRSRSSTPACGAHRQRRRSRPTTRPSPSSDLNAADLFTAPSRFWSIGPALAQSIFDAGLRRAQTEEAIAAYDATVAEYRQAVLAGFQEVEDNLAALRILGEEAEVQEEAVRAARESVLLTTNQYKAGIVSYINVVTVQTTQLSNERTAVGILGRRLVAAATLVKALGGGWSAAELSDPEALRA